MNTNNVKTKLAASVLAVIILFITIPSVNVSAESQLGPGLVGGTPVYAKSSIYYSGAYGTTYASYYDAGIHAEIYDSTYTTKKQGGLEEAYQHATNAGTSSTSVNFNAQSGYYSRKIECDHQARRIYELWAAHTDATY